MCSASPCGINERIAKSVEECAKSIWGLMRLQEARAVPVGHLKQTKVEECRGLLSRADAPGGSCEDASDAFRHGASTGLAQHVQHDLLAGRYHPHPGHHVPHYGQCQQQRCSKGIRPLWHATVYTTGHSDAKGSKCIHTCQGHCNKTAQLYTRTDLCFWH